MSYPIRYNVEIDGEILTFECYVKEQGRGVYNEVRARCLEDEARGLKVRDWKVTNQHGYCGSIPKIGRYNVIW